MEDLVDLHPFWTTQMRFEYYIVCTIRDIMIIDFFSVKKENFLGMIRVLLLSKKINNLK